MAGPSLRRIASSLAILVAAASMLAAAPTQSAPTQSRPAADVGTAATAVPAPTAVDRAKAAALRREAMELAYNLDRPQAIAFLEEAVRIEPDHPANHRLLATLAWLRLLWDRGAVTVDDYLGKLATKDVALSAATASSSRTLAETYARHLALARQLAERRLAERPNDPDALYEAGAVYGLETSYHASVEGRMAKSFGLARKAHGALTRVLTRDPKRHEAGYYVGSYRCLVAELPAPVRLLAYLGGLRGNKSEGLALIEAAASHAGEAQGQARYTLVLFYNRDRRFGDALRILDEVRRLYPRNRQFLYEAAATRLRAGLTELALDLLTDGIDRLRTDSRPRWFGEEAQWHFKRGLALAQLQRWEDARRDLDAAQSFEAPAWVKQEISRALARVPPAARVASRD